MTESSTVDLRAGHALAFLGDSLTEGGWNNHAGWVHLVVESLAARGLQLTPVPAGISGHRSNDMLARLDEHVLASRPEWMLLSCGVNDVWHGPGGVPLDAYRENVAAIAVRCVAARTEPILLTSTTVGEDPGTPENTALAPYNDFLREYARQAGLALVDVGDYFRAVIAAGPGTGDFLTVDGVHFNDRGERAMAAGVLRGLGYADEALEQGVPGS